jgi:hypothetical protein
VPFVRILPPGDAVTPAAVVEGQNIGGESRWYRIGDNEFIWAGATTAA